jgi:hypothetical protein
VGYGVCFAATAESAAAVSVSLPVSAVAAAVASATSAEPGAPFASLAIRSSRSEAISVMVAPISVVFASGNVDVNV